MNINVCMHVHEMGIVSVIKYYYIIISGWIKPIATDMHSIINNFRFILI